ELGDDLGLAALDHTQVGRGGDLVVHAIDILAAPHNRALNTIKAAIGFNAGTHGIGIVHSASFVNGLEQQAGGIVEVENEVIHAVAVNLGVSLAQLLVGFAGRIGRQIHQGPF